MTSQRLEKRSLSSQQGEEEEKEEEEAVGVVDADLKVHGVDKLRVADASVFPHIPSAPIASVVMSVGLAAGELINGHNGQF
jgi:choline dehydrogenase-like flavoprotein